MTDPTTKKLRSLARVITSAILLLFSGSACAGYAITANELMLLPTFCRQLHAVNYAADAKKYRINAPIPPGMQHVHHYCHGLKFIVRATSALNRQDRIFNLNSAIGEFKYVLIHTHASAEYFPYLAMVRVDLGRAYRQMGNDSDAINEFLQASHLKRGYVAAYIELINVYSHLGNRAKALDFAREGLTQTPNSKILRRKYLKLGGKLPYPSPAEGSASTHTNQDNPPPTATPAHEGESGAAAPAGSHRSSPANIHQKTRDSQGQESNIGSPTNPWCRFCPPPPSDKSTPTPTTP